MPTTLNPQRQGPGLMAFVFRVSSTLFSHSWHLIQLVKWRNFLKAEEAHPARFEHQLDNLGSYKENFYLSSSTFLNYKIGIIILIKELLYQLEVANVFCLFNPSIIQFLKITVIIANILYRILWNDRFNLLFYRPRSKLRPSEVKWYAHSHI